LKKSSRQALQLIVQGAAEQKIDPAFLFDFHGIPSFPVVLSQLKRLSAT
jgi:hypothetical protein